MLIVIKVLLNFIYSLYLAFMRDLFCTRRSSLGVYVFCVCMFGVSVVIVYNSLSSGAELAQ